MAKKSKPSAKRQAKAATPKKAPAKPSAVKKPVCPPSKPTKTRKPVSTAKPKVSAKPLAKVAEKKGAAVLSAQYSAVLERVKGIIARGASCEAKMLEICWLLNSKFPHYNWVGFYIATKDKQLVLGPFVGEPTEHTHIPFGSGICGQAAEREETFVVQDVSQQTNYLSCSAMVKSEIVVPIIREGVVLGELDIDSHKVAPFTPEDRKFLESVCKEMEPLL